MFEPLEYKSQNQNFVDEHKSSSFSDFVQKTDEKLSSMSDSISKNTYVGSVADTIIKIYTVSEREVFIDFLVEKHKFKRAFLISMFRGREFEMGKDDEVASLPESILLEKWLGDNYDIRFNIISNIYEYKLKYDSDFLEFNEFNILRKANNTYVDVTKTQILNIIKSDFTEQYNPIYDYFRNSTWDGFDHISHLCSYVKVSEIDRERFNRHFRMMFIRTIAGAISDSYNKRCLVFVGGQDAGKTYFCNWLCPKFLKEYKSDEIDFNSKDGIISLGSNFWIILDELAHLSKAGINTVKSVLSKNFIKVRLPYDAREKQLKRRCSFIGNTNDLQFLNDPSGSVRWICFKLQGRGFDWNYSKDVNIDQVWAQAYHLFINGERFDMNKEELEENESANLQFTEMSIEMELLNQYIKPTHEKDPDAQWMTASDIVEFIAETFKGKTSFNSVSIGKALKKLNFQREQVYIGGDKKYCIYGYYVLVKNSTKNNDELKT